ncbi:hypothetical protein FRC10_001316 [Ceratobasidium sp. 414]|nr:hypothetical protein FRC10_001316 [Ceratobasidium sp. 414]
MDVQQYDPNVENTKHEEQAQVQELRRSHREFQIFKKAIEMWRKNKYLCILDEMDICLDAFMTDKQLTQLAQFKINSVNSFDHKDVCWSMNREWQQELFRFVQDLEVSQVHKQEQEVEQ